MLLKQLLNKLLWLRWVLMLDNNPSVFSCRVWCHKGQSSGAAWLCLLRVKTWIKSVNKKLAQRNDIASCRWFWCSSGPPNQVKAGAGSERRGPGAVGRHGGWRRRRGSAWRSEGWVPIQTPVLLHGGEDAAGRGEEEQTHPPQWVLKPDQNRSGFYLPLCISWI